MDRFNGKEKKLAQGAYPDLSLKAARAKRAMPASGGSKASILGRPRRKR